jgi:hypothetical protein
MGRVRGIFQLFCEQEPLQHTTSLAVSASHSSTCTYLSFLKTLLDVRMGKVNARPFLVKSCIVT